jgi:hypothetical protein
VVLPVFPSHHRLKTDKDEREGRKGAVFFVFRSREDSLGQLFGYGSVGLAFSVGVRWEVLGGPCGSTPLWGVEPWRSGLPVGTLIGGSCEPNALRSGEDLRGSTGQGRQQGEERPRFSTRGKSLEQQLNRELTVFGSPQKARTPEIVSRIGIWIKRTSHKQKNLGRPSSKFGKVVRVERSSDRVRGEHRGSCLLEK